MAEIVVGAVVTVLIEKLSEELINFARSKGIDSKLEEWKKKLPLIQDVLADAGQKEITQKAVQRWLLDLQSLAYDIDDVLDDIATEVMKRQLNQQESHGSTSKVMKIIIPACCTNNFTPHNFMFGRKISSKLDEITARLHDLFQQKNDLGLKVNVEKSSRTNKPLEETSLVDESGILGREEDKQALLEMLLGDEASNCHNVKIVSIVGLGGVGKTTLARVLYNNEKVKGHFELRAWVCVSDEFDVLNVSKAIYQAACGENKKFATLDLLHVALNKKLSNKRFLLVLDDVWNENHGKWELLKRPLVGAPGSKVIVTTRNTDVALVMNSVQTHNLAVLSDETALSLFAQYALEEQNFDKHPSLKSIAQGIIKKCDGLPLALVTLGRVLKTKGIDHLEWEELLKSEIWKSQDGSGILPALKLSYYHLPSYLKQVFAYCSMFPKKTEFEKKKLILLWMAQGFLSQPEGNDQPMESLGGKYFKELLSRSFFQPVANDESLYTMHDLMNDLATSVARDFFFRLDDNMDLNDRIIDFKKFRHFSFVDEKVAEYRPFEELHSLRTFLLLSIPWQSLKAPNNVILKLLPKLESVRVLSLSKCSIAKVPQSVGRLKHLRYLNFSNTDIERIPEQVSELYNLQSLLVRGCPKLSSLPVSFVKLINLRHLDMTHTRSLKKLPLGMGGLTSLQTLSKVVIQEDNGFRISDLKGLKDLQGELSIEGLEKVRDRTEAKDANLQQKKGLDDLEFVWSNHDSRDSRKPVIEFEVLESLRVPSNLKKLKIRGYGEKKFPDWVGDPSSLKQVTLRKCHSLESYSCPTNVELLDIEDCDSLRSLSLSKLQTGLSSSSSFSSNLKILRIHNCKNISSISQDHLSNLISLEEMWICKCPSMEDSFSSYGGLWAPNLRKLTIGELKKPVSELGLQYCRTTLVELELNGKDSGVGSLGVMEEQDYNNTLPPNLRQLRIIDYHSLKSYCCPNSVEKLDIWKCSSMTSLTFSQLQADRPPSSSANLKANLKILLINNCKNIKSISQEHLQSLTSLEVMWILDCPSMEDTFPSYQLLWPPNLRTLRIGGLKKPMSEWGLQNYPHSLVKLMLEGKNSGVVSFGIMEEQDHNNMRSACFLLPRSLTSLEIVEFDELESLSEVLRRLPRLQRLDIWRCPKLDVPEATSYLEVYVH